jgi:plastocyanin
VSRVARPGAGATGGKLIFTAEGVNVFYHRGRFGILASSAAALMLLACSGAAQADTYTVSLSLTKFSSVVHTPAGDAVGISPAVLRIHVGDRVIFKNDDTHAHTATGLPGKAFVDDPMWTDASTHPSTTIGTGQWSTGEIHPGASSPELSAKTTGTFLYGCFFDYSAGMRGEIIVEP